MGVRTYFEQVDPATLRPCPKNKYVFGPTEAELTPEFLASIKEDGVLAPVIVNSKRMICDGHRRTAAAVKLGLKLIPCYVSDHEDIDKTLHAWDVLQKQVRVRTKEQTARLFGQYKAEEAETAATVEKSEKANVSDLSHGEILQPVDRPDTPIKSNEVRDKAAKRVGMSGATAERALAVVKEIDKAEASGNVERAEDLREKLETQPVAVAYRAAKSEPEPEDDDTDEEESREWTKPDASTFRKAFQAIIRTIDRGAELEQLTVPQHAQFLNAFKKFGNDWQKLFPEQEWL